jgi:hypothetical protein
MSSTGNRWPPPAYGVGPLEHVHAIGVIALTYATLQNSMDRLFLTMAGSDWAEKYYYLLSEENRSSAIKKIFKDDGPDVVEAIGNLVEYFDWCRACRNNLLHAESYRSGLVPFPGGALGLTKRLKKGSAESGYMALTLQELRGIAGRMQDGIIQCAKIYIFVHQPDELEEKYRYYLKSLPPKLPIPKPISLASNPRDLWSKRIGPGGRK